MSINKTKTMSSKTKQEYQKEYYLKNKERMRSRRASYKQEWRLRNNDKVVSYRMKGIHDPLVYLIVNENYVGTTTNLSRRISSHKSKHNRDVSEIIILSSFKDKSDAFDLEEALHSEGFKGRHFTGVYK